MLKRLVILLTLCVVPVLADGTRDFAFKTNLGDIGPTDTFTIGGDSSLSLTGFYAAHATVGMWEKNAGPNELGLGLDNGINHEISSPEFIQINLNPLFDQNKHAIVSVTLGIDSIQGNDAYAIWGGNTPGIPGTLLADNQTKPTFTIPDLGAFDYISITAASGTVLLDDINVQTPEPASLLLLLVGMACIAFVARRRILA